MQITARIGYMKQSFKFVLILSLWAVLLSWYLRVFPHLNQPGMIGGYGVLHDWPRFHLVETGMRSNVPSGMTETSAKMYMPEDLTTYLLAMYTLISGNVELLSGLGMMTALPNLLYFIPAVLGVSFYRQINNKKQSNIDVILVFVSGLFVSSVFISYTDAAINQAGYGISIYAMTTYIMFKVSKLRDTSRWIVVFVIILGVMVSVYHTQGLLAIFVVPSYYVLEYIVLRFTHVRHQLDKYNKSPRPLLLSLVATSIMITVGLYYSALVQEITTNLISLFLFPSENSDPYVSAKSSLFRSSLGISLSLDFASRLSKVLIRSVYLLLITYFFHRLFRKRFRFEQTEELFLLLLLILYPVVFVMFFLYGGIGVGAQRTAAAGAPITIFVLAYILNNENAKRRKQAFRLVIVTIIFLTIIAQTPVLQEPQQYTKEEVAAIQFTGQSVETSQMVFSDPRLGAPLLYYQHRGLVYIRVVHAGWEQRLRRIFFTERPGIVRQTVAKAINNQTISKLDQASVANRYIFTTKRLSKTGISLESLTYRQKPDDDFYTTFDSGYNRVYNSGDGLLYVDQ